MRTERIPTASENETERKVIKHRSETEVIPKEDLSKSAQRLTLDRKLMRKDIRDDKKTTETTSRRNRTKRERELNRESQKTERRPQNEERPNV